jgi:uncharacterized phiE125 gp8 family phage protein
VGSGAVSNQSPWGGYWARSTLHKAVMIVTPATSEIVTVAEARQQARVDITDDDNLFAGLIAAARRYVEQAGNFALLTQTRELALDAWPNGTEIYLPGYPLQSVASVTYIDYTRQSFTFPTTDYVVDARSKPGRILIEFGKIWPPVILTAGNGVIVQYVCGWTAAALVPQTIKQAMLLLIGDWYENREASTVGAISRGIEIGVHALIGLDRALRF